MADEVYQTNVYVDDRKFLSFRKVGFPYFTVCSCCVRGLFSCVNGWGLGQ